MCAFPCCILELATLHQVKPKRLDDSENNPSLWDPDNPRVLALSPIGELGGWSRELDSTSTRLPSKSNMRMVLIERGVFGGCTSG